MNETLPMSHNAEKALWEIIRACKDSNTKLLFYTVPINVGDAPRQRINTVKQIAAQENIPLLDLNCEEWLTANEFDSKTHFRDGNKHPNWHGAIKITRTLGDYLINEIKATDHRGDPDYASWDQKTPAYYQDERLNVSKISWQPAQKTVKPLMDPEEYLQALIDMPKSGGVIISAYDEASNKMTEPIDGLLMQLGAKEPLRGKYRHSYLPVNLEGETALFEVSNEKPLVYEAELEGVPVVACSRGFDAPKEIEGRQDLKASQMISSTGKNTHRSAG